MNHIDSGHTDDGEVPSVVNIDDDDDDEDIANLFSFGGDTSITTTTTPSTDTNDDGIISSSSVMNNDQSVENHHHDVTGTSSSNNNYINKDQDMSLLLGSIPTFFSQRIKKKGTNTTTSIDSNNRTVSPDPFLELLEAECTGNHHQYNNNSSNNSINSILNDDSENSNNSSNNGKKRNTISSSSTNEYDPATQEILNWLEKENTEDTSLSNTTNNNNILSKYTSIAIDNTTSKILVTPPVEDVVTPTVVALPPIYNTLYDALISKESTIQQICDLYSKEQAISNDNILLSCNNNKNDNDSNDTNNNNTNISLRAELYCRMICHNKSLDTIIHGSLADSFQQWIVSNPTMNFSELDDLDHIDSNHPNKEYITWIRKQQLANRIVKVNTTGRTETEIEIDLIHLLLYHHQSNFNLNTNNDTPPTTSETNETQSSSPSLSSSSSVQKDPILPMIASTLLAANIPVSAAAVVLTQIIPSYIPLLALPPNTERIEAALFLYSEFYLLAYYHIPLLVIHLDKYIPGWYWPKLTPMYNNNIEQSDEDAVSNDAVSIGRNLKKQGQIPLSWLVSHLSGECDGTMLPIEMVLMLWDRILTGGQEQHHRNNATRFFLTLAVLERQAPTLLLLTDDTLLSALQNIWTLETIDDNKEDNEKEWQYEWRSQALCLQLSTPESVLDRLQKVEDEAIQHALQKKQDRAEALLKERLEAEAAIYREAQELKAEEARIRLSRARLIAFYRKHAPDKESNIEKIMETYVGRLDVLDAKLKEKYGEGFNPAIKAKTTQPPQPKTNLLAKMNQRLKRERSGIDEEVLDNAMEERKPLQVSVYVTVEEVLPVICWSKEATAARGLDERRRRKAKMKKRNALKFYLIDCRPEEAVQEQGRFPTAFRLSPETMHDPEKIQEQEDILESFRGAVHIVIMGEGYTAIPNLYNQKLSPKLQELMEQDESRTNLCALFFQKRGFCFVSLLTGGFCSAHSWLVRDGPKHHLNVTSVLVDYNPEISLFGQLEKLHNASMTEKAQRKMANLLEASMVTVTKRAIQLERLTAELNDNKDGQRQGFRKLFGRSDPLTTNAMDTGTIESTVSSGNSKTSDETLTTAEKSTTSTFQNPFASIVKRDETIVDSPNSTTTIVTDVKSVENETSTPVSTQSYIAEEKVPVVDASTPTSDVNSTSTTSKPGLTPTTSATNSLGKFFQQTSDVVGVAAAAAASATMQRTDNNKSNESSNVNKPKDSNNIEVSNPFKGFGAAFQQTRARFGGVNIGSIATKIPTTTDPVSQATASTTAGTPPPPIAPTTSTSPGRSILSVAGVTAASTATTTATNTKGTSANTTGTSSFGFNNFRKSAMSRVLQATSQSNSATNNTNESGSTPATNTSKEEISVTFV